MTSTNGFVYLLQSAYGCKIGFSKNPPKRLRDIGTLPFPVTLIHTIKTNDMPRLEKEIHSHFEGERIRGEWFNLNEGNIFTIMAIKSIRYHFQDAVKNSVEGYNAPQGSVDDFLSIEQAAAQRKVSYSAILNLVRKGRLRSKSVYGRRFVFKRDVDNFNSQRGKPKRIT